MKVLEINKFFPPHIGGIEKVVKDIADFLGKVIDLRVLVCSDKHSQPHIRGNVYKVVVAPTLFVWMSMPVSLMFPLYLRRMVSDVDIVHFHLPFPLGVVSYILFCRKSGHRLVVSWYSDIVRQKVFLAVYGWFLKLFLKRADAVIVPAPGVVKSSAFLPKFRSKCEVIPIGIDIKRFELSDGDVAEVDKIRMLWGKKIVLFVGRLVYYKGVDVLIESMKNVGAVLLIVGNGPLEGKYREMIKELGLEGKVSILTDVDDTKLPYYYHACDVFVLPSVEKSEAYGIVQLEAMACRKPVVSTSLPTGVTFVNRDGVTGFVVPVRDPEKLAEAINTLMENPDLRKKYGENARRLVEKEFTLEVMNKRILNLYEKVMSKN